MSDRGQKVLEWAVGVFGPVATDRRERAVRLVEEAVEVAQAEGVPLEILERVARRCYSRPVGNVVDELGAVVLTLEALASNIGVDLEEAGDRELARVTALDPLSRADRHRAKVAEGCAVNERGRFVEEECTGVSAKWCPVHGDCTCPHDPEGWCTGEDPACPLHSRSSTYTRRPAMPASRDDLGAEGNEARRRFWERCAAGALTTSPPEEAALQADEMLAEWDKRWIAPDGRWRCAGCGLYVDPDPDTPDGRGHRKDNDDGSPGYCGPVVREEGATG